MLFSTSLNYLRKGISSSNLITANLAVPTENKSRAIHSSEDIQTGTHSICSRSNTLFWSCLNLYWIKRRKENLYDLFVSEHNLPNSAHHIEFLRIQSISSNCVRICRKFSHISLFISIPFEFVWRMKSNYFEKSMKLALKTPWNKPK